MQKIIGCGLCNNENTEERVVLVHLGGSLERGTAATEDAEKWTGGDSVALSHPPSGGFRRVVNFS